MRWGKKYVGKVIYTGKGVERKGEVWVGIVKKKKRKWKGNMVRRKEILRVDKEGVKMMLKY